MAEPAPGQALLGPALVGAAALLWATDTPFRFALLKQMNALGIVFCEHLVGLAVVGLWSWSQQGRASLRMTRRELLLAALVGVGGSALASVLFTASFRHVSASVAILIQKLQPIFVVLTARIFLNEKPRSSFYGWAALALVSALVLSLSAIENQSPRGHGAAELRSMTLAVREILNLGLSSRGVLYALGAAILWAVATVAGKTLVKRRTTAVVTTWRYAFGLLGTAVLLLGSGNTVFRNPGVLSGLEQTGPALAYTSFVSGLLAMLTYYAGLTRTAASVATFVELLYPVSAVLINLWVLHQPLGLMQAVAGGVLLFAVTQVSR